MPINNFGSNLRVETTVGEYVVDNDALQSAKARYEHNRDGLAQNHVPWAQSYRPDADEEEALRQLYEQDSHVEPDPLLQQSNEKDLHARNLLRINNQPHDDNSY